FANAIVPGVSHENVATWQHRETVRAIELRLGGGATVAGISFFTAARDDADEAAWIHASQTVAEHLDDEGVASGIKGDAEGAVELDFGGRGGVGAVSAARDEDEFCGESGMGMDKCADQES